MSTVWRNWAGEQLCAPSQIVRPTSEAELAEVVVKAAQRGERVRAVGTGHSFTDCACTDGVMVDMAGMQRVIDVDVATGLATVQGGPGCTRCSPSWPSAGWAWRTRATSTSSRSPGRLRPPRTAPGRASPTCRRRSFRCDWSPPVATS
ncbi:FAD binding domain protein [Mycobacterium kansasii 824]|nr:FAD binding domain protein [Mycobacterium kansasii 824]